MAIQAWRNQYRMITVCVDSYVNGVLNGRLHNPYRDCWIPFQSLTQFLKTMEETMDEMVFPRAFNETRIFSPSLKPDLACTDDTTPTGKLATFGLRVLFRQNASWQGSISWMEGRQEESFRSVLELILLMDNALTGPRAE